MCPSANNQVLIDDSIQVVHDNLKLIHSDGTITPLVFGNILGQGSFAIVRRAKSKPINSIWDIDSEHLEQDFNDNIVQQQSGQCHYAVKCIDKNIYEQVKETSDVNIQQEIDILSKCSNMSFVAQMIFQFEDSHTHFIGLEYCGGGDLHARLAQGITRQDAVAFIAEIAYGLSELHRANIVYHDLKPENICLNEYDHIKLIDFGLAVVLDDSTYNSETGRNEVVTTGGTLDYSAPEIFFRNPHAYEVDWWSFGVLAYEMLSGQLPFYIEGTDIEQCEYICSSKEFHRNEHIIEGSIEESFLSMFLEKNPAKRFGYHSIDIDALLHHKLFS